MKREGCLFWILMGGLLFLRFPWMILGKLLFPGQRTSLVVVYELGTYLLTALLILLERRRLAEYHIDMLALVLLLGAPFAVFLGQSVGAYGLPGQGIKAAQAVMLLVALLIWRPVLPRRGAGQTMRYIGAALLIGMALAVASGFLLAFQVLPGTEGAAALPSLGRMLYTVVYQLDYAAAAEELLFRGFLWGRLRALGWKESRIWLFQALLFVVGHVYYVGTANISAFLVVPLGALVLGLSAWKSRSIGVSMVTHGVVNAFGNVLGNLFYNVLR